MVTDLGFKVQGLRVQELRVTGCGLRVAGDGLQVTGYGLPDRFAIQSLRSSVDGYKLWVLVFWRRLRQRETRAHTAAVCVQCDDDEVSGQQYS
jgi:hypothetical protein